MTRASKFLAVLSSIREEKGRYVRVTKVTDGTKVVDKEKVYMTECPDGYSRNSDTGKCERMSSQERRTRSIAATKSSNKSSTKRNREKSMRRRDSIVQD